MNRPLMESSQAEDDALVAVTGGLTWKRRWCIFFEGLRLEIVLFLYTVTFAMRFVVTQQLLLFKTCRYYFDYSESFCKTLDVQNATVEAAVTKMADVYNLLLILAEFVPAALVSVFVSSWCDKHGNRIPIVVSLVGAAVLDVGTVVSVLLPKTPLFVNVLLGLVCGATGGIVCMTAVVQSNASKSTADDMRTVKFLFVMAALLVGIEVGQLVSGQLFKAGGYLPVYCVSAGIVIACSTFVILGNVGAVNRESTWRQMLKDLTVANFGEGYRAALGRRPNGLRHRLTLLAVSLGVILFNGETSKNISYFYMLERFQWSVTWYSDVGAASGALGIVCSGIFIIVCSRVFKVPDLVLAMIGVLSMALFLLIKGLASQPWMYYVGCVIGSLTTVAPVGILAHVSKLISKEEAGRVFAFWSSCESLVPIGGNIFSSLVFNAVLEVDPGLPFFISAGLTLFPLVATIYCFYREKMG